MSNTTRKEEKVGKRTLFFWENLFWIRNSSKKNNENVSAKYLMIINVLFLKCLAVDRHKLLAKLDEMEYILFFAKV